MLRFKTVLVLASGVLNSDKEHSFPKIDSNNKINISVNGGGIGNVYKSGNIVNYSNVPANSKLIVVAYDGTDSYEFFESVSGSGPTDLSSKNLLLD